MPQYLHFVCSPTRALEIIRDIDNLGWTDGTKLVYEPIPDLCVPSEMPALLKVLPRLHSKSDTLGLGKHMARYPSTI